MTFRPWSANELRALITAWPEGIERCLSVLPTRTEAAIRTKASELKIATGGAASWSEREEILLQQHYPDYLTLRTKLPNRTKAAIKTRARDLGLQKACKTWTAAEVRYLVRRAASMRVIEIHRLHPEWSLRTIMNIIKNSGHRYGTKTVMTGTPLLDAIRQRCISRKIQFKVVAGRFGAPKGLSATSRRKGGTFEPAWVPEVVALLGGELYVEWDD